MGEILRNQKLIDLHPSANNLENIEKPKDSGDRLID